MKKTQLALAALALVASTAVLADGVTVYGNLEAAVVKGNENSAQFSGAGQWGASAFGIKGSEDLGGGLTAAFNLESGIDTNRGGVNNGGPGDTAALFNRAAWVSVGGGFGTVKLGNQVSPFIVSYVTSLGLAGNNFLVPVCANAGACDGSPAGATTGATGGFFIPNSFSYSFSAGGINGQILRATPNSAVDGNSLTAGNLSVAIDALSLTAAISDRDANYRNILLGGTYTIGGVKLAANFIDNTNKATANSDSTTTTVGASYALSEATTVGLNYSKTSLTAADDRSLANLSLMHALSKRTSVYTFFNKGTNSLDVSYQGGTGAFGATAGTSTSAMGLGVAHAF